MFRGKFQLVIASVTAVACAAPQTPDPTPQAIDLAASSPEMSESPPLRGKPCEVARAACADPDVPAEPAGAEEAPRTAADEKPPVAAGDQTVWHVPITVTDPVRGPADALVTAVIFSDFECPFCKQAAGAWQALLEQFPKDLRLVWKDLPLPQHQQADFAAHFARAVQAQRGNEGFWKAHDLLFENQPKFDNEGLYSIARQIGDLNWNRIRADIREERHAKVLYECLSLADRVGVRKTPTVFLNGRKIEGAKSAEELDAFVRTALDAAQRMVEKGTPRAGVYQALIRDGKQVDPPTDLP